MTRIELDRLSGRPVDAIRILAEGELAAGGRNHRALLRLNGHAQGYHSFVTLEGASEDATPTEWADNALVAGRNRAGLDTHFRIDVSITSVLANGLRIALGNARYTDPGAQSVEYLLHGYLTDPRPIERIEFGFEGGTVRGSLAFYTLL